jgi:hypothetical protein
MEINQENKFKGVIKYLPALIGIAGLAVVGFLIFNKTQKDPQTNNDQTAAVTSIPVTGGVETETAVLLKDIKPEFSTLSQRQPAEIYSNCEVRSAPSEKFDCYGSVFAVYMKNNGGRKTLELLDTLQRMGGYIQTNCHPLSHRVGNIALYVYETVPKAVPEYIPVCHSGYYHGLLEEYLATAESYEKGVAEVCGTTQTQIYFNWFQCTHGLGHGVMQFRDNEVPQALKDCDIIDVANNGREICYAGVFMENITTDEKTGHPAKYIKKEDPIYPCNGVEDKYRSACYFLSSSQILKINGWNFPETFKVCDGAEEKYRFLCYQSLGRDVSGSTQRNNQRVKELCDLGSTAFARTECYFGAVRDYINEVGQFDTGIGLCNFIDQTYRDRCYSAVFFDMQQYKKGADFDAVCDKMPETYKVRCKASNPA